MTIVPDEAFRWILTGLTAGLAGTWLVYDGLKLWWLRAADRRDPVIRDKRFGYAIGMVIGAAWNGARAFTSTAGPGISLMSELLGLAYYAEIPAVVIDVQRTGPSTGMPNYSVTKAAVLSLSRLVADLYAKDGVRCNAVTPGPTATGAWLGEGGLADQQGDREEVLAKVGAGRPLGRLANPDEIANVIVFLCSDRSSYVTGAAWSADGGTVPIII